MGFFRGLRRAAVAIAATAVTGVAASLHAQTLTDYCGQDIAVGLRDDAPPFSYAPTVLLREPQRHDSVAQCGGTSAHFPDHAGFTVAICATFLDRMAEACSAAGAPPPVVRPVSLRAGQRIAALTGGDGAPDVDLLCGATTATVWLSGRLPHTMTTFLTPTRALLSDRFGGGDGQCRIGVVSGTTSSKDRAEDTMLPGWRRFVQQHQFCGTPDQPPPISVSSDSYPAALMDLFDPGQTAGADLLIADLHILQWYQTHASGLRFLPEDAPALRLGQRSFTLEPYAIFGGHDDAGLVTLLNLHLAAQQRDGTFRQNVSRCFGRRIDERLLQVLEVQERTPLGLP